MPSKLYHLVNVHKAMNREKLFEILELVESVYDNQWRTVMALVDHLSKGTATLMSQEWFPNNRFREGHHDLCDIKTWSTFNLTCIDLGN